MQSRKLSSILFLVYLLLLTWMIVFKMDLSLGFAARLPFRSINFIPLAGTAVYDGVLDYREIGFNILSFIPFGIYMEMLFRKASWVQNLAVICLVSLVFEGLQFLFFWGVADVTDLLANGLGGAIGINIMYVLTSIWHERAYGRLNSLALLVTLLSALLAFLWLK